MKINKISSLAFRMVTLAFLIYSVSCEVYLSHVLPVSYLGEYVNTALGRNYLEAEYNRIPDGMRKSASVALLPANIAKNRYEELPAFDETRVVLERVSGDPNSDYINANYIDGYYHNKEYVATQGPLPNTINDFWRMVWQLNTTKIIMLANIIEHGKVKVEKYWPDSEQYYGKIYVKKLGEVSITEEQHVIRTFLLQKAGQYERRIVRHFHFTGWPDMGVPANRMSIVSLLQQVRKYRPESKVPIVVHCSAGVGRTGTVILTDTQLEKAKDERTVDFPKQLNEMRRQRINVVEKAEQYIFGHEAVNDMFNDPNSVNYLRRVDAEYENLLNMNYMDYVHNWNRDESRDESHDESRDKGHDESHVQVIFIAPSTTPTPTTTTRPSLLRILNPLRLF